MKKVVCFLNSVVDANWISQVVLVNWFSCPLKISSPMQISSDVGKSIWKYSFMISWPLNKLELIFVQVLVPPIFRTAYFRCCNNCQSTNSLLLSCGVDLPLLRRNYKSFSIIIEILNFNIILIFFLNYYIAVNSKPNSIF